MATLIIGAALAGCLGLAAWHTLRNLKKGGCAGCSSSSANCCCSQKK